MSRDTVNVTDPITGEAVDVPAHEMASEVPLLEALNWSDERVQAEVGGEENLPSADELPVLLTSDFRTDPVEGQHGSYTLLVSFDDGRVPHENCPNCGYDRAEISVHTFPGVRVAGCRVCDWSEEI